MCIYVSVQNIPELVANKFLFKLLHQGISEGEMRTVFRTDCQLTQYVVIGKMLVLRSKHSEPPLDVHNALQILHFFS